MTDQPRHYQRKRASDGIVFWSQDEDSVIVVGWAWWHWPMYRWGVKSRRSARFRRGVSLGLRRAQRDAERVLDEMENQEAQDD